MCWRGGKAVKAYYEAARPDVSRKRRRETGSGNAAVLAAGTSLREQARHLDQNHDLARGVLNTLVQNTVGHTGVQIDPMPRGLDGKVHRDLAQQIRRILRDFYRRPEVTHQLSFPAAQRLAARSYFRDGECLIQHLPGRIPTLDHGKDVPYSIELIESDLLPMDYDVTTGDRRVRAGIEVNAWGRPRYFWLYKEHPGELLSLAGSGEKKRVSADRIMHMKMIDRIGQLRGVSVFASVMLRLDDVKDYEESERIAAKVAASMAAYIKKGTPDQYQDETDEDGDYDPRNMRFRPGMVFDDLLPGEDIGTIDTKRPNVNLEAFRNGQIRALSAGTGTTFSTVAKTYDGTFSAQRQELVEGWGAYQIMSADITDQFVRPTYERLIETAVLYGRLVLPADLDAVTLHDAVYQAPQMPWIDPAKEAKAWETLEDNLFASAPEIIRKRGVNPEDVLEQQTAWLELLRERGINQEPNTPEAMTNAALYRTKLLQD